MSRVRPESLGEALTRVVVAGSGDRPPLVLLHVWAEDVHHAALLASGLEQRKVISLPRPPLVGGRAPTRYEDWITHYAQVLDELDLPEELPLYLAGWSQGFRFCVDVARTRRAAGKRTDLVINLDATTPWIEARPGSWRRYLWTMRQLPSWRRRRSVTKNEVIYPGLRTIRAPFQRMLPVGLRRRMLDRHPTSSFWWTADEHIAAVRLINFNHANRYEPFDVDALIVASEQTRLRARNDSLGWDELLTGSIVPVAVPGGHWTLLSEPFCQSTIDRIDACLRQADGHASALSPEAKGPRWR